MSRIIGQQKLLDKINKYTSTTLPKTMLFLGPRGCGKYTFINYLTERFALDRVDLTDKVTQDQLIEYSQKTIPTLYVIDLTKFLEKQQNQFLKFIEEPAASVYVALRADSEIGVLPTILNRCIKFTFERYSKEDLMLFNWENDDQIDERIYEVCKTPGDLFGMDNQKFKQLYLFCEQLLHNIQSLDYFKTYKQILKFNYKDLYDKFDFDLFFETLDYIALKEYRELKTDIAFKTCMLLNKFRSERVNKNIIKENFMMNFLTQFWKETR